jgi:alkanesulfonate monooxygenase SsuD/methylene tetrahydromethanopterin reductase-like flavin-dependent oxidoreductase (luciferase family)
MQLTLFYDLRAPSFGPRSEHLYEAALEQCEWADGIGFAAVRLGEHHGATDGYCPSPVVFGAAIAARTKSLRIHLSALVAPLHHPIRAAEELAVLDVVSHGRLEVTVVGGYRTTEFAMFGAPSDRRGSKVEEMVETLKLAWTGQPFEFGGQEIVVRPTPVQVPRPPIYLGGSSPAAARRAARIADDFRPGSERDAAGLQAVFRQERERLGLSQPPDRPRRGPWFLHITEDPESAWAVIARHALHEVNTLAAWKTDGLASGESTWLSREDTDAVRRDGRYQVLTPTECIKMVQGLGPTSDLQFHPLLAGLDPDFAWSSLDLFERRVLPKLIALGLLERPAGKPWSYIE